MIDKILRKIWVLVFQFKREKIQKIESYKHDSDWILESMKNLPGGGKGIQWVRLDKNYWTCSIQAMRAIAVWDWTGFKFYRKDKFDCDNFALMFMSSAQFFFGINSIGMMIDYDTAHAYNLLFLSDGTIKVFEPQFDKWPVLGEGKYKCEHGVLVM